MNQQMLRTFKKACWWLCYGLEMYSKHHSSYQIKTKENCVYCFYPLVLNPLNSYLFMYLFINTPHSANMDMYCVHSPGHSQLLKMHES